MSIASGRFEIQSTPQPPYESEAGITLARVSFDKQFQGDLTAASRVEMLSARTPVPNSAGYVAIERVKGTLHGKHGSFVLKHDGTMDRGRASLTITVVPDSGTEELTGLSGQMRIEIEGGVHSYRFEYTLGA